MGSNVIDEIGPWSEVKLEIIQKYGQAYSKIFNSPRQAWAYHIYIDGFCGPGVNISRETGRAVKGSPLNALLIDPPFKELFLIDIDGGKLKVLEEVLRINLQKKPKFPKVTLREGDCNEILMKEVFPMLQSDSKRRALCLLDPYGLHLSWEVIAAAGQSKKVDMFLNFPMYDMSRNVLWHNPKGIDPADEERMNAFWGDDSWKAAYGPNQDLFGIETHEKMLTNYQIALKFQERLRHVAGFSHVADPIPMRNSKGGVLFYLFLASQKIVAKGIMDDISKKYRDFGLN